MNSLKGRSAVITGGITGQGLAIARRFAAEGINVALGSYLGEGGRLNDVAAYPASTAAAEVKAELEKRKVRVHASHLDVRDNSSVEDFVRKSAVVCGAADILVNAAGTSAEHPVCGHPDDLWQKIIDTNLTGAFRMTRALLPGMIERQRPSHAGSSRSEEHTSELQSLAYLVCRLLLEKKKKYTINTIN